MHISKTLVEFVLRGELPRRLLDDIERDHLECLCSGCAEGLKLLASGPRAEPGPRPEISPDPLEAIRRRLGLSLTKRQVQAEEEEAREDVERFFSRVPVAQRYIMVYRAHSHYRGSLFGTLLLERARRVIPHDPAESLSLAEAALISAERTHRKAPDPRVRVPALAVRGNAKRALGRFVEAEADLLEARLVLDRSELDDLPIAAELDFYLGSLRKDQSRFEEALRHLERAVAFYPLIGDLEKTAATFVKLGIVHHRLQRFDAAIASTEEALKLLGVESPEWLRAYAHFNLALFLQQPGSRRSGRRGARSSPGPHLGGGREPGLSRRLASGSHRVEPGGAGEGRAAVPGDLPGSRGAGDSVRHRPRFLGARPGPPREGTNLPGQEARHGGPPHL